MCVESDLTGTKLRSVQSHLVNTFLWGEKTCKVSDFGAGKKVSLELANMCREREAELHVHSRLCTWWRTHCGVAGLRIKGNPFPVLTAGKDSSLVILSGVSFQTRS